MIRTNQAALWLIALLVTALVAACSTPSTAPPGTSSSSGAGGEGAAGGSTSSSGGSGGTGGVGGSGGAGGTGGSGGSGGSMMAKNYGPPATETVSSGHRMKSGGYTMVMTMGQPSPHQTTAKSQKYRIQTGLVGATESLP